MDRTDRDFKKLQIFEDFRNYYFELWKLENIPCDINELLKDKFIALIVERKSRRIKAMWAWTL